MIFITDPKNLVLLTSLISQWKQKTLLNYQTQQHKALFGV